MATSPKSPKKGGALGSLKERLAPFKRRKVAADELPEFARDVLAAAAPIVIPDYVISLSERVSKGDKAASKELGAMFRLLPQTSGSVSVIHNVLQQRGDTPVDPSPSNGVFDRIAYQLDNQDRTPSKAVITVAPKSNRDDEG